MREISAETIRKKVYDLILQASYHIGVAVLAPEGAQVLSSRGSEREEGQ